MEPDFLQPEPRRWLSTSVLAAIEGEYVSYLRSGRYHSNTVRVYLACVAHFAKWVTEQDLELLQIDETVQLEFLETHLPICACHPPVRKLRHKLRVAVRHLLQVLRSLGQIPFAVNRRSKVTPYRRAKGTPLRDGPFVDAGRKFRSAGGVGRA